MADHADDAARTPRRRPTEIQALTEWILAAKISVGKDGVDGGNARGLLVFLLL
jgi:hypothetical protein